MNPRQRPVLRAKWLLIAAGLALASQASHAADRLNILFIGSRFLHGNFQPTLGYNKDDVKDFNGSGYGGVAGIWGGS